jgi:hypothetical protein
MQLFTSSNLSQNYIVLQQTINLNSGWNLVSFYYIEPYSNKINDLIFGTSIEIIKNEHQYWNSNQNDIFNSLNRIKVGNGYMIYAQNEETIQINGIPINETTQQLELSDGWNIVGTIEEISFIDYIQTTNCIIIKDYNNYFSINESSPNFTHFEIGKAYFIKK